MSLDSSFKRNVPLLALCQALFMSGTSLIVATTALVGFALSDDKSLASLPFAAQLLATMLTSIPAAMLMARLGRKAAFMVGVLIAMCGASLASYAIVHQQFVLFILGCVLLGVYSGFANYYRFTAADNVEQQHKSRAISYVLAGGVLAAVIGPNLANLTRDVISDAAFAGSYASIIVLHVFSFILLSLLKLPQQVKDERSVQHASGRPLSDIARQPRFVIAVICGMLGYAIMSLIMTATPLAMQHHHHVYSDTAFVIQWHVLGMFVPSFFTGYLIHRFGLLR
ncbi:MAG: MFS transporter, partial [Thioalkalispiraceae bacterium]